MEIYSVISFNNDNTKKVDTKKLQDQSSNKNYNVNSTSSTAHLLVKDMLKQIKTK